ncbi:MAG: PilW family protein [Burkholderiales bacterium]|jgi:type IV pilus assembly protein PilW|nr:PilW family protein [Burkholderiales bacterium]
MKNSFFRQKGMSIIELMVAVLIGVLAMYAVYLVYEGTERTKRNVTSVGDTQVAGLYSIFVLESDIKNAGSGIINAGISGQQGNGPLLANCSNAGNTWGTAFGSLTTPATFSFRPTPVLIVPNTGNPNYDDIYVSSGNSTFYAEPVAITVAAGTTIAAPAGIKQGDVLVDTGTLAGEAIAAGALCQAYLVPNTALPNGVFPANAAGLVTLNLQGASAPTASNWLVNLGVPVRRHFYVDNNNTLQMEDWALGTNGTWNRTRTDPVVTGVISLRAAYGIAPAPAGGITNLSGNNVIGAVDTWTFATSPWDAATILNMPSLDTVRQIKAVWLSIIVQSDEPEFDSKVAATLPTTLTQFQTQDCPTGATACPTPNMVTLPSGGHRYRMYETMIPLVNTIWN